MDEIKNKTKKEAYLVEGMSCSGCERAIQKVIGNLQGVKSVKADLASASVFFEYDPELATIDMIKSAVNKIGYKIVGELPSSGKRESRDDAVA
jgi:copper chaperone CopZ